MPPAMLLKVFIIRPGLRFSYNRRRADHAQELTIHVFCWHIF